jgi:hypothetical protein
MQCFGLGSFWLYGIESKAVTVDALTGVYLFRDQCPGRTTVEDVATTLEKLDSQTTLADTKDFFFRAELLVSRLTQPFKARSEQKVSAQA